VKLQCCLCARCRELLARYFPNLVRLKLVGIPEEICERCRQLFAEHEDDDKLASLLEQEHSVCRCENVSVGVGSPGPVRDNESLHRIIASPRDYDPATRTIRARPFERVFTNGLSVWRARGPEEDIGTLLMEALRHQKSDPHGAIFAVCEAPADRIRSMQSNDQQLFCIYDQTVTRADPTLPPVGTHASIFLRVLMAGTPGGKKARKDFAGKIWELFIDGTIQAVDYRNGLCTSLNARAAGGEFAIEANEAPHD
jgi:hypothetical protein